MRAGREKVSSSRFKVTEVSRFPGKWAKFAAGGKRGSHGLKPNLQAKQQP
jgi:hypothetical protein